jgi:hypothetical protein
LHHLAKKTVDYHLRRQNEMQTNRKNLH